MSPSDLKNLGPPLSEARLARQYAAIQSRAPTGGGWRSTSWRAKGAWGLAAASTVALVAVLAFTRMNRRAGVPELADQTVLESGPADPVRVTLIEGSRVDLAPSTRARLTSARATAIRIDLEQGAIEVEATHVDGRTFIVGAGSYEVHVVGTHFVVQRAAGERVTVRVDRGVVEVSGAGAEARRLGAGEVWSAPDGAQVGGAPSGAPPAETAAPSVAESPATAASAPPASRAEAIATGGTQNTPVETAMQLFDEGQRARASGRVEEAVRAFDRLRHTFPHDPRAALAALEVGRLRLDALGDPRGAEEAFRDAMRLAPASPFREDAEARRVEALGRMGDESGCAAARSAYLARWTNGTYRREVELGCAAR